jgi:succinate dehydrogenase / fumarate reductase cytochrome b subunit
MMPASNRPLSPHLLLYKPQLTSVLSIVHRATGVALAVGLLLVVYWLVALAAGPETFGNAQRIMGSWIGKLILFGFTFALFYHLCNGIRHLFWDAGLGLDLKTVYASGWSVLAASIALSFLTWVVALV